MTRWEPPMPPWHPEYRKAYESIQHFVQLRAEEREHEEWQTMRNELRILGYHPVPDTEVEVRAFYAGVHAGLKLLSRGLWRCIKGDDYAREYHSQNPDRTQTPAEGA